MIDDNQVPAQPVTDTPKLSPNRVEITIAGKKIDCDCHLCVKNGDISPDALSREIQTFMSNFTTISMAGAPMPMPLDDRKDLPWKPKINTDYMGGVYRTKDFVTLVQSLHTRVSDFRRDHDFDSIAFRGSSGAAAAYPLSYLMGMPLSYVRKPTDQHHYNVDFMGLVEGCINPRRYVIVDDFINSGDTMRAILGAMEKLHTRPECLAIFEYRRDGDGSPFQYFNKQIPRFGLPRTPDERSL